jgi:hypothetical protein
MRRTAECAVLLLLAVVRVVVVVPPLLLRVLLLQLLPAAVCGDCWSAFSAWWSQSLACQQWWTMRCVRACVMIQQLGQHSSKGPVVGGKMKGRQQADTCGREDEWAAAGIPSSPMRQESCV